MGHTFGHSLELFCLKSSRWIFTKPPTNFLRFFLSLALAKNVGINFLAIFCLVRAVVVGSFCRNFFGGNYLGGNYFGGNQFWQEPGGNYFGRNQEGTILAGTILAGTILAGTILAGTIFWLELLWQKLVLGLNSFCGNTFGRK